MAESAIASVAPNHPDRMFQRTVRHWIVDLTADGSGNINKVITLDGASFQLSGWVCFAEFIPGDGAGNNKPSTSWTVAFNNQFGTDLFGGQATSLSNSANSTSDVFATAVLPRPIDNVGGSITVVGSGFGAGKQARVVLYTDRYYTDPAQAPA